MQRRGSSAGNGAQWGLVLLLVGMRQTERKFFFPLPSAWTSSFERSGIQPVEVGPSERAQVARSRCGAVDAVVVDHHERAVAQEGHIELHPARALLGSSAEGGNRILRRSGGCTAMGLYFVPGGTG